MVAVLYHMSVSAIVTRPAAVYVTPCTAALPPFKVCPTLAISGNVHRFLHTHQLAALQECDLMRR